MTNARYVGSRGTGPNDWRPPLVARHGTITREVVPFEASESLKHVGHSPDGFEWGYNGSGPSQLAFALLLDVTGDPEVARRHYVEFRFAIVSGWPEDGWSITSDEIREWLASQPPDR